MHRAVDIAIEKVMKQKLHYYILLTTRNM